MALLRSRIKSYITSHLKATRDENDRLPFKSLLTNKTKKWNLQYIIWVITELLCLAIVISQTYERITYYLSTPVSVQVHFNEAPKLPTILFLNQDVPALKPYWKKSGLDPNTIIGKMKCTNPIKTLMELNGDIDDYDQLWKDSDVITSFSGYRAKRGNRQLSYESTENIPIKTEVVNDIVYKIMTFKDATLKLRFEDYVEGKVLIADMETASSETEYYFTFNVNDSFCNPAYIKYGLLYELMPFRYVMYSTTNISSKVFITTREYTFLPGKNPYCETKDGVSKECYEECIKKTLQAKSKNQTFCRLPYMRSDIGFPDCNSIKNKSVASNTYKETHSFYFSLSSTVACGCKRPCNQKAYNIRFLSDKISGNEIIVGMNLGNEATEKFVAQYEYGIPKLLIDFGGNLGLFLGLSLLSTVQLGHVVIQKRRSSKKIMKSKLEIKVDRQFAKEKPQEKNSTLKRVIIAVTHLILIVNSIYIISERVKYYMTVPTRYVIEVKENETLHLPPLLACGETGELTEEKIKIAPKLKKNPCDVHFLDVLDNVKSLDKLWELASLEWHPILPELLTKVAGVNDNYLLNTTLMHSGTCYELEILPHTYAATSSVVILGFMDISDTTCNDGLWQFYVRPKGKKIYSVLQSRFDILNSVFSMVAVRLSLLVRVNTPSRPCMTSNDFDSCKDLCFETKVNALIQCRLPFMEFHHYPLCNSSESAKKTYNIYIQTALQVDKTCNCSTSCHQDIYVLDTLNTQESDIKHVTNVVCVSAISNLIEMFKEEIIYNLVALFCEIGNIFGMTLGLSVLALFAYTKSALEYVLHKVYQK